MARACSAPEDTVHYMHTMNWVKDVMGASHLDLLMAVRDDARKEVGSTGSSVICFIRGPPAWPNVC
jgi:hypothetical protein